MSGSPNVATVNDRTARLPNKQTINHFTDYEP